MKNSIRVVWLFFVTILSTGLLASPLTFAQDLELLNRVTFEGASVTYGVKYVDYGLELLFEAALSQTLNENKDAELPKPKINFLLDRFYPTAFPELNDPQKTRAQIDKILDAYEEDYDLIFIAPLPDPDDFPGVNKTLSGLAKYYKPLLLEQVLTELEKRKESVKIVNTVIEARIKEKPDRYVFIDGPKILRELDGDEEKQRRLFPDGLHPTEEGQNLIFNDVILPAWNGKFENAKIVPTLFNNREALEKEMKSLYVSHLGLETTDEVKSLLKTKGKLEKKLHLGQNSTEQENSFLKVVSYVAGLVFTTPGHFRIERSSHGDNKLRVDLSQAFNFTLVTLENDIDNDGTTQVFQNFFPDFWTQPTRPDGTPITTLNKVELSTSDDEGEDEGELVLRVKIYLDPNWETRQDLVLRGQTASQKTMDDFNKFPDQSYLELIYRLENQPAHSPLKD